MRLTKKAVRDWLLAYAWSGSPAEREAEVDCIMAHLRLDVLDARIDRDAGRHETGGGPEAIDDATAFELSALYECHDAPHLATCPLAWHADVADDEYAGITPSRDGVLPGSAEWRDLLTGTNPNQPTNDDQPERK